MRSEYRHLRALRQQLEEHVEEETMVKILEGMDTVKDSSRPEIKVQWADEITRRLDTYLDKNICIKIRENCACLISNDKSIYAKIFRKLRKQYIDDAEYLDATVNYLNSTTPLRRCGEVSIDGNKIITIIASGHCDCSGIKEGLVKPISVTWCHCCKGSILSVIKQIFPERKCNMIIKETYASGGNICMFESIFEYN